MDAVQQKQPEIENSKDDENHLANMTSTLGGNEATTIIGHVLPFLEKSISASGSRADHYDDLCAWF